MTTTLETRTQRIKSLELTRVEAVVATVVVGLAVNLLLWLIGLGAGGSFEVTDAGEKMTVAPGGVVVLSVVPTIVGMTAAALLSLRWVSVIRIAQVVGPVLSLATIAGTILSDFDGASTVSLAAMHVALAAVVYFGLEGMRRGITK
ncbi:DUF6069 family protein [Antrihabitans sp. YC2-6]|uniref:DUF6069 family protein n=1 Tax=Antrihabitans sp. YC2-6 TaxID=2799498 RepID=UPI0018F7A006|nr:DUF6069 family protein [Antrihabitans sp. YC2-6]MBJ8344256.1 hypothetical protein [Antrihabitans sp. YC2-6]